MCNLNQNLSLKTEKITSDIIEYIDNHCHEKITLNMLAERCFYNPSYFSRLFKDYFGMNLLDYINQKRIEKSCILLKSTNYNIDDICFHVGYSDKTQFYKQFKHFTGTTPSHYRVM